MNDLRFALRQLFKHPGFALAVIFTLALGVGANTAIFTVVHSILLRPLPYQNPERLVRIASLNPNIGVTDSRSSGRNILDWQRESSLFEGIAAFQEWDGILAHDGQAASARVNWSTPNLLPMLGIKPFLGELLPEGDEPASGIVLPYGVWRSQFGGDPNIIGKWIKEDDTQSRVTGVLPPDVTAPGQSLANSDQAFVRMNLPRVDFPRGWQLFNAIGRLKPGVTVAQAQAELGAIAARLEKLYPDTNRGWTVKVTDLKTWMTAPIRDQLWTVYAATAVILLMACLNVSNLLLIRGAARRKEFAIRCAIGSTRAQLIRQLLIESLFLACAGGLAGLFVAFACQKLLFHFAPESLGLQIASVSNGPTILSALISSIVAAILFGLFPALRFSRGDLNTVLGEATRGATISKSAHRVLGGLVSGQIAISTLLLVATALAIVSFQNLGRVNPGFAKNNTLFFRVGYLEGRKMGESLVQTIAAVPGVEVVGASHIELLNDTFANPVRIAIDDKPDLTAASAPTVNFWLASKDYFSATGIPLIAGRTFTDADEQARPYPILINEAFAKRYFPNEDPIGKTLHIPSDKKDQPGVPRKIIGVVASVRQRGLREEPIPILYALYTEFNTGNVNFVVRTRQNPPALIGSLRAAIKKLNPELIVTRVSSGEDTLARSLAGQRFATQLMFTFATIGALLAAVGLYGMLTYAVTQRTREIGLRIALGAQRKSVLKMILQHGLSLTAAGLLAGLAAALILARAMRTLLYNVSPTDPATYALIAILLITIALLACWLPARRATRIDPITALRED